jgi:hypothetical protein
MAKNDNKRKAAAARSPKVPAAFQPAHSPRSAQAKTPSAPRRAVATPPVFRGGNVPVNVITHTGNKPVK